MGIVNGFGNLGNLYVSLPLCERFNPHHGQSTLFSMGSYVWKGAWGPDYHPSMIIGIASMSLATALALLMRYMLIAENKQMERDQLQNMTEDERQRIEDAAKLEGLTMQEALERRRGFRLLY